jgi:restriction endonuclease Mrr
MALLDDALKEENAQAKGDKFEIFFQTLVAQDSDLSVAKRHARSDVGEIDYICRTQCSGHPLWATCGYLFIECKNWTGAISSEKMDHFIALVEAKNFLTICVGIYITTSTFSRHALNAAKRAIREKKLAIMLVEKKNLSILIEKGIRQYVQDEFDELVFKS